MKTCPIANCQKTIKDDLLMCPAHWARVPFKTQMQVRSSLRAAARTCTTSAINAYKFARAQAIKSASPAVAPQQSPIVNQPALL